MTCRSTFPERFSFPLFDYYAYLMVWLFEKASCSTLFFMLIFLVGVPRQNSSDKAKRRCVDSTVKRYLDTNNELRSGDDHDCEMHNNGDGTDAGDEHQRCWDWHNWRWYRSIVREESR